MVKEMPAPLTSGVLRVLELNFNEKGPERKCVSQDDDHFIQLLSENIKQKDDGHLEMPLPFRAPCLPGLPNNKRLAIVCLQHLKRKLKSNGQFYDHYKKAYN